LKNQWFLLDTLFWLQDEKFYFMIVIQLTLVVWFGAVADD